MSKRKYPFSLFIVGFFTNLFKYSWLFIPGIILLIVGIFSKICLYIGLGLLALAILFSLIEEIKIIRVLQKPSDDPEFSNFQDALSDKNWANNVTDMVRQKIENEKTSNPNEDENTNK